MFDLLNKHFTTPQEYDMWFIRERICIVWFGVWLNSSTQWNNKLDLRFIAFYTKHLYVYNKYYTKHISTHAGDVNTIAYNFRHNAEDHTIQNYWKLNEIHCVQTLFEFNLCLTVFSCLYICYTEISPISFHDIHFIQWDPHLCIFAFIYEILRLLWEWKG